MPKGKGKGKRSSSFDASEVTNGGNGVNGHIVNGGGVDHNNGVGVGGGKKKKKIENGGERSNGVCQEASDYAINPALTSPDMISKIRAAWLDSDDGAGLETAAATVSKTPFTCCSLRDFAIGNQEYDVADLVTELGDLEFAEKSNDLYKFRQSADLAGAAKGMPRVRAFRELMRTQVKDWLQQATGIELDDTVDMFCARYDHTDYLSCHDDELEGRRIAYIFYLVPGAWSADDGGALELLRTMEDEDNGTGNPGAVARSLVPRFNSLTFFEVTPRSWHQVTEVLSRDKTRLSISGWFHGETAAFPRKADPLPLLKEPPVEDGVTEDEFFEWINPSYLDPGTQVEIQENFEGRSEIQLSEFLAEEKRLELAEALLDTKLRWQRKGPANRRCYDVLKDGAGSFEGALPEVVKQCLRLFKSDAMFLLLSNMTGLRLHPLAPADEDDDDDKDDKDDIEDKEDKNVEEEEGVEGVFAREKSPKASSSKMEEEGEKKEDDHTTTENSRSRKKKGKKEKKKCEPTCAAEVRRWKQGYYTMLTDGDAEEAGFALDARLFLNCHVTNGASSANGDEDDNGDGAEEDGEWPMECGGYTSYIAKNEDEELLSVAPQDNALTLAYRDADTLRFVKRVTDAANARLADTAGQFHDLSVVYYE